MSDLYDMLVEQGMDGNLIGSVFEKLNQDEQPMDEESVWFESQFTQFSRSSSDVSRGSVCSERRSGVKKVDDEYLI